MAPFTVLQFAAAYSRIVFYSMLGRLTGDRDGIERRKHKALDSAKDIDPFVALNVELQRKDSPGDAFQIGPLWAGDGRKQGGRKAAEPEPART